MMQNCPSGESSCKIHYFEGWNEFNTDGFWTGNYTELAVLMSDAATIIRAYCPHDCFFAAGSVASGGQGYHALVVTPNGADLHPDNSGIYVEALGQLLRDWSNNNNGINSSGRGPDMLSYHPYPGYDNISMPAMPETNEQALYNPGITVSYTAGGVVTNTTYGPGNVCTGKTQQQATLAVLGITLGSGGSGYAVNDVLNIQQSGSSETAQVKVTSVSGSGAVTGVSLITTAEGSHYSVASGLSVTGGTGSGATVNVTSVGLGNLLYDANGNPIYAGTPSACVNTCGHLSGGSTYNPVSGLGCTAYLANPSSWSGSVSWPGCGTQKTTLTLYKTSSQWVEPTPLQACVDSFVNSFRSVQAMVGTVDVTSGFLSSSIPIWNTESGWGSWGETDYPGVTTASYTALADKSLSTFLQQAFIARMAILGSALGNSGMAANLWYQWDENTVVQNPDSSLTPSFGNWGQLATGVGTSSATSTEPGNTFNRVYHWLSGNTFSGTTTGYGFGAWAASHSFSQNATVVVGTQVYRAVTAGTTSTGAPTWNNALYGQTTDNTVTWENMGDLACNDTSTFTGTGTLAPSVWQCAISNTSGYQGLLVWATPFDIPDLTIVTPTNLLCLKDIDGNLAYETQTSKHHIYNRPALFDNTSSLHCSGTDGYPQ